MCHSPTGLKLTKQIAQRIYWGERKENRQNLEQFYKFIIPYNSFKTTLREKFILNFTLTITFSA